MAKIKLQDVQKAVATLKEAMPLIEPIVREHGPKVAEQAGKMAHRVEGAVEDATKSIGTRMSHYKDGRARKREVNERRRIAVANSLPPISAEEFFRNFEANVSDAVGLTDGYLAICGCYAIITLKSSREKDLSTYKDVYVGCSKSVGLSVYSHFKGLGNVDVYADFKFKEPMRVLLYPCEEGEMLNRCTELSESLQAFDSYNGRDLELSGDGE